MDVLRTRLQTAEEALRAIRTGEVDAFVGAPGRGTQVMVLAGAELAYQVLFDQMNEGAVTLTLDGVVAYCNRRLAEILRAPLDRVVGAPLRQFVTPVDTELFEMMRTPGATNTRGDLTFQGADGTLVPVAVSFAPLRTAPRAKPIGMVGVILDITERKIAEDERARLAGLLMTAQEEERRRIARELHDEVGQSLTALLVGLRSIEGVQTVSQSAAIAQSLRETTARTLVDVGRLWRGLHPGVLDDLGLAAAVVRHADEFAATRGLTVVVDTDAFHPDGLSPAVQATAYRIVLEALNNVAQHAGARRVSVRLRCDAAKLEVRVQDDGAGFQPGNYGRLGLRGMRERAALLGGALEVYSQAGKGTTLTARFPVSQS